MILSSFLAKRRNKLQVPKLIHSTSRFPLDPCVAKNWTNIQKTNPDFSFRAYCDTDIYSYIESRWGQNLLSIYELINPEYIVARTDLWRYLIIYDRGGIYLDDKSGPRVPFTRIIQPNDELILTTWNMNCDRWIDSHGHIDGEFAQWCLIARPRHPLIKAVIIEVICRILAADKSVYGKFGVISTTGPLAFTDGLLNSMEKYSSICRIEKNSYSKRVYFNAISKSLRITKAHHGLRVPEHNYRLLSTPLTSESMSSILAQVKLSGDSISFAEDILADFNRLNPLSK